MDVIPKALNDPSHSSSSAQPSATAILASDDLPEAPTSSDPNSQKIEYLVEARPLPPGTPHNPNPLPALFPYPIRLKVGYRKDYFIAREGFNAMGMLKSPMMLLMFFTAAMVFAMPKILVSGLLCAVGMAHLTLMLVGKHGSRHYQRRQGTTRPDVLRTTQVTEYGYQWRVSGLQVRLLNRA